MSDPGDRQKAQATSLSTFFCESLADRNVGSETDLAAGEAPHLRTARIRPGDLLLVTDGAGRRCEAELVSLDRRRARCRLRSTLPGRRPLPLRLWAPVANRDRALWLVEKAVELGVSAIVWLDWERSRSVGDAGRSEGFLGRASARARAALKQSGGCWLPELAGPVSPDGALAEGVGAGWLADADGSPALTAESRAGLVRVGPEAPLTIAVGPEGGLTDDERRRFVEAGFRLVALGRGTLRFETAAVVAVALASALLDAGQDSERTP